MVKIKFMAAIVALFMAFLAAQAATGFMQLFFVGSAYPRAMRAIDWALETVFTRTLGQTGGAIAILGLGLLFVVLVWRRAFASETGGPADENQTETGHKASTDAVMQASEPSRKAPDVNGPVIWTDIGKRAWVSHFNRSDGLAYKRGAHTKFYNHDWEPATYEIPAHPDDVHTAFRRHWDGYPLQRSELTEALAVFDAKRFAKEQDLFMAGPFAAVKGELADLLSRFDLGEGGLVPLAVYEADLVTPFPGEFFLLNFGARKNSLLPEQSTNVDKLFAIKETGFQYWKINSWHENREIALSSDALDGPDLWFEEKLISDPFVSDVLAQAVIEAGMAEGFKLKECRILQSG